MKKLFYLLPLFIFLTSCKSEDRASYDVVIENGMDGKVVVSLQTTDFKFWELYNDEEFTIESGEKISVYKKREVDQAFAWDLFASTNHFATLKITTDDEKVWTIETKREQWNFSQSGANTKGKYSIIIANKLLGLPCETDK